MPTIAITPSLEATQAVGALLLHQFARERFSEEGIDESLILQAEYTVPDINVLVSTLLHENENNDTTSCNLHDETNQPGNTSNGHINETRTANGGDDTNQSSFSTSVNNTTARTNDGPSELFHSIAESTGNGTPQKADKTLYHSMNASETQALGSPFEQLQASPSFASLGRELRRVADEFANSPGRVKVKDLAESVKLHDLTKEGFEQLLEALFQGKITGEGIVALFFFCTDLAMRAVHSARKLVVDLLSWSFSYIIQTVCSTIYKLGGWEKVLSQSIYNFLYNFFQQAPITFTGCAILAIWFGFRIRRALM